MILEHPIYEIVRPIFKDCSSLPKLAEINRLKASCVSQEYLHGYHFVDQNFFTDTSSFEYEKTIYQTGQIMTRELHWHDFFNAMVWMSFPQTKASLNKAQCRDFNIDSALPQHMLLDSLVQPRHYRRQQCDLLSHPL